MIKNKISLIMFLLLVILLIGVNALTANDDDKTLVYSVTYNKNNNLSNEDFNNYLVVGGITADMGNSDFNMQMGFLRIAPYLDGEACEVDSECLLNFCCSNVCQSTSCPVAEEEAVAPAVVDEGDGSALPIPPPEEVLEEEPEEFPEEEPVEEIFPEQPPVVEEPERVVPLAAGIFFALILFFLLLFILVKRRKKKKEDIEGKGIERKKTKGKELKKEEVNLGEVKRSLNELVKKVPIKEKLPIKKSKSKGTTKNPMIKFKEEEIEKKKIKKKSRKKAKKGSRKRKKRVGKNNIKKKSKRKNKKIKN